MSSLGMDVIVGTEMESSSNVDEKIISTTVQEALTSHLHSSEEKMTELFHPRSRSTRPK